jgi:uncharacterized membrane protein YdjX (TVP38/TMEM64 family)
VKPTKQNEKLEIMSLLQFLKLNKKAFSTLLLSIVLPFITYAFLLKYIINNETEFLTFVQNHWLFFLIIVTLSMSLSLIHTTFISILGGYFWDWASLPYIILSYLCACCIGYYLGRLLDNGALMKNLMSSEKAALINNELRKNEFNIIVFSRLSPILPFGMMNLILSYLKTDFKKYLMGSFIGMLPRCILFIFVGLETHELVYALKGQVDTSLVRIVVILLLIGSIIGLFYYIVRPLKNRILGIKK